MKDTKLYKVEIGCLDKKAGDVQNWRTVNVLAQDAAEAIRKPKGIEGLRYWCSRCRTPREKRGYCAACHREVRMVNRTTRSERKIAQMQAAEVSWYRVHGRFPTERIRKAKDGTFYVIGDWSWHRLHKDDQHWETVEPSMMRDGVYSGFDIQ